MDAILHQLGLDSTFFVQFVLVALIYFALSHLLFKPFQRLFELRYQRTVEDRRVAAELRAQSEQKSAHYQEKLAAEKKAMRESFDKVILEAKKEEAAILQRAREEAKAISQSAMSELSQQSEIVRNQVLLETDRISQSIVEKLLVKS